MISSRPHNNQRAIKHLVIYPELFLLLVFYNNSSDTHTCTLSMTPSCNVELGTQVMQGMG